jgi:cell division protein ZipA
MDKDVIRIIIFFIGLVVIIGMIAWSYVKHEKQKRLNSNLDELTPTSEPPQEQHELEYSEEDYDDYDEPAEETDLAEPPPARIPNPPRSKSVETQTAPIVEPTPKKLPIIQFSIVATEDEGFNGMDLYNVLDDVGLEYGNLQIFERLDARRLVDFGVASMVKPGIFPSKNLAGFHCPGIVFFMQPSKLDNPVAVFDDFVRTFQYVAMQLNGEMWDHRREPLTEETIAEIRDALSY